MSRLKFLLPLLFLAPLSLYAAPTTFYIPATTTPGCINVTTLGLLWSSGSACGTGGGPGGSTFAWPFTKQADGSQATSTTLGLFNGFNSQASSTLTKFTFDTATGTSATTTNLYVSGLASTTNLRANTGLFGNLGIGMAPIFNLDVTGSIRAIAETAAIDITNNGIVVQRSSNDSVLSIGYRTNPNAWGIAATYSSTGAYRPIAFYTSDAERLRIDTAGNIGIGIIPNYKLEVNGTASTTNLFATSATTTNATTSSFAISNITSKLLKTDGNGVVLGATAGTDYLSAMTFAWPWTKQADLGQATSTLIEDWGGLMSASTTVTALTITGKATSTSDFLALGSTTLQTFSAFQGTTTSATSTNLYTTNLMAIGSTTLQNFTAKNATTSQATTTNFAVSGLSSNGFVKTYGGTGNFTIDTNTYLTSAVTAVTATYPILATTGNTPALSFAFGTTTANSWSLLNQFNLASTSVFSAGFASFGRTSTTTINGTGDLFVVSSTTLQNFTATNATTSQATTTNFAVTQSATLSKIPYIGPSGNIQALGIGTNLTLTNGTLSASGGSAGIATTTMATTTSTVTGNALAYLLNDTDILSIGAKATTTAKFWIDPNVLNPTYLFTLGTTTAGSAVGASVLYGITPNGHFSATSTRPGISGCGSGATITGTDAFGMVTPGTSQPGICLVTFNKAYANAPVCQVTGAGYSGGGKVWLNFNATTSTTLLTITSIATATGATTLNVPFPSYRVAYDCKEVLP